jgi:hypothetical protein
MLIDNSSSVETPPLGYRFRHSHGGTGCGSAHNLFRASLASFSNSSSTYPLAHTFGTTSTSPA